MKPPFGDFEDLWLDGDLAKGGGQPPCSSRMKPFPAESPGRGRALRLGHHPEVLSPLYKVPAEEGHRDSVTESYSKSTLASSKSFVSRWPTF